MATCNAPISVVGGTLYSVYHQCIVVCGVQSWWMDTLSALSASCVGFLQYLNLTVGHHVQCPHSVAWFGQLWYGIVYHILVCFGVYHTKWDTNQTVNVPVTQQKVTSNKKKNKQQSSMQQFTSPPLQTLSTHTHHFDLEAKVNLKCAFLLVVCVEGCIGGPAFTALQHLRVGQRRSRMTRHF